MFLQQEKKLKEFRIGVSQRKGDGEFNIEFVEMIDTL